MAMQEEHLCQSNSYPVRLRRVTWIKTNRGGVKSGYSSALKLDRFDLTCKANKCSDAGTRDLRVLITNETSPCFSLGDAGVTRPE